MKFGLWTAYGALNSKSVFEAFAKGASKLGHNVVVNEEADIEVIWSILWHGRMARNKLIWDRNRKENKPIIVLEHSIQDKMLKDIIALNLSSRDVEEKVRQLNSTNADEESFHYKNMLENLLGTKVTFKKSKNKTKISFTLNSKEDLDSFIKKIS